MSASTGLKQAAKRLVAPAEPAPRTVLAGVGRGVRMRIDFGSQTRMYLGLYEIELDRHLRRMLQLGVAAFDVGAQHGYDSLAIVKRTGARVAAFESDPARIRGMRESFALNPGLAHLIEPVEATVGNGPAELRLDDWVQNGGFVPGFIKIDVEGAEVGVLRSAARILSRWRPALVVEVHSPQLEREAGGLLMEHGYRPRVVSQRRLWPDHRPIGHNRWLVAYP
jgi:hypothetical protein